MNGLDLRSCGQYAKRTVFRSYFHSPNSGGGRGTKLLQEEEGGGGQDLNFPPPIAKIYLESWPEEEGFYIIFISSLTSGVVGTILIEIATINIKGLSVRNTQ